MYTVTRIIRFCYGHRLMNYEGKCRHLHGHNGKVEIELGSAALDQRGMVRDFEEIKRSVQAWIDSTLDHTMLLRRDDPLVPALRRQGERCLTLEENPTAEAIARMIYEYTAGQGFPVTEVRLWETEQSFASYARDRAGAPARGRVGEGSAAARRDGADRAGAPRRSLGRRRKSRGRRLRERSTSTAA